ncbi:DUF7935 family protein [Marinifilum fragile]|uniref:DUF7935 family protein n=1 Tax=Marinifilum fragile TaxID=570161 RepID=UPI0006D04647|nr:hypothetical protein [Marinifilum fragile]
MTGILEISKYILPSLVVFATAYFVIKAFFKRDEQKRKQEIFLNNQKEITPIRLQAYERLIIFLERIHPESLIVRENVIGMNNQQLQQKLVSAIRTEFEHNLSQQMYVSGELWKQIKAAKENIIQLINSEASQLITTDSSLGLSKAVIESHMQIQNAEIDKAIATLKNEVSTIWK